MAINVKHGVNAGAVAAAAFGAGQGRGRRAGVPPVADEERRRRGLLARQQAAPDTPPDDAVALAGQPAPPQALGGSPVVGSLESAAQGARAGLAKAQRQAGLDATYAQTKTGKAAGFVAPGTEAVDAAQARVAASGQALSRAAMTPEQREARERMDYASGLKVREGEAAARRTELALTTKQKRDLDQLAQAEADLMVNPTFTKEEKEEAKRRIDAQRAGIKPVERAKAPTAAERFRANTYVDQRTGNVYPFNEDGTLGRPIHVPPSKQATMQDRRGAFETAGKLLTANLAPGAPAPSLERIQEVANLILNGGSTGGGDAGESAGGSAPGAMPSSAEWGGGEGGAPTTASLDEEAGEFGGHSGRYDDVGSGGYLDTQGNLVRTTSDSAEAAAAAPRDSGPRGGRLDLADGDEGAFYTSPGLKKLEAQEAAEDETYSRLTQAKPNTAANLSPDEVNDLPTVEHQLREAEARLAEDERMDAQADQKLEPLSGRNTLAEVAGRVANPLTRAGTAASSARGRREAAAERVAKLRARKQVLAEEAEEAEGLMLVRRMGRGGQ